MTARKGLLVVGTVVALVLSVGVVWASPAQQAQSSVALADVVNSGIGYQGRLTSPSGASLSGSYTMRFVIYDDSGAGSALWDSGNQTVTVERGLFNTILGVDHADFDGQALWLSITIDGETLSPRQEILPAPYALSLRPGADIVGDSIGAADATIAGYAPATGTAVYADAGGGVGLYGDSEDNYGVWGTSDASWGGYFTSTSGHGIRVDTDGTDHYDYGAYVTSEGGYAVYAQSANNQALRGEAGNTTGVAAALGRVGVVGMGQNRGVHGASSSGLGVYGTSTSSTGVFGNTSRSDRNFGLYTNDNLFSFNVNLAGAVMQIMQNNGSEALSPGDVVVFNGVDRAVAAVDGPIVQVQKAGGPNQTGVAGVVASRFNMEAVAAYRETDGGASGVGQTDLEFTPAGNAAPGDYVLVVVQGPALVNSAGLTAGSVQPGDLLATGATAGSMGRAATMTMGGVETTVPGTVFGKALEPIDGTREQVYVYVTLQ